MRLLITTGIAVLFLSGCSMGKVQHFSTYDLNRDGVLDARCPGMEYEQDKYKMYSWRAKVSRQCAKEEPLEEES